MKASGGGTCVDAAGPCLCLCAGTRGALSLSQFLGAGAAGAGLGTSDIPPAASPRLCPPALPVLPGCLRRTHRALCRAASPAQGSAPCHCLCLPAPDIPEVCHGSARGGGEWGPRVMGKTDALGKKRGNLPCALRRGDGLLPGVQTRPCQSPRNCCIGNSDSRH